MALLRERSGAARHLLGLTALLLAGCVLMDSMSDGGEPPPFTFNHFVHVDGEGLECTDCHMGVDNREEPGMPALAQCMLCHSDLDAEKPPDRHVRTLFDADERYVRANASLLDDPERIFPHLQHVESLEDCEGCHAGVGTSVRMDPRSALTMDQCMDCHAQKQASNACETCHAVIRQDVAPESHRARWERFHGQIVRAQGLEQARCTLCHQESSCTSCHLSTPPESHTNFWRLRGHGIAARMDRDNCSTCHRSDSCSQCHSEMLPLSHSGMFGSPRNTHCFGCHFPLKSNDNCATCHKSTPSHAMAAPKPPDHNPAMNCRLCHGNGVQLPHVDKGDDCNICHH